MQILIGTKNPYKAGEMEYMLEGIFKLEIHFLKDMDLNLEIEEDGKSLIENARKKAIEISKHTDMYVLTSDGGVDIPKLDNKWDILKNQRIVGHDKTDLEKVNHLLSLMVNLKGHERECIYSLAMAIAYKGELLWSGEDVIDRGFITEKLVDEDIPKGFWMGHVWYYPQFENISTRISKEEQLINRKQVKNLKKRLQEYLNGIIY